MLTPEQFPHPFDQLNDTPTRVLVALSSTLEREGALASLEADAATTVTAVVETVSDARRRLAQGDADVAVASYRLVDGYGHALAATGVPLLILTPDCRPALLAEARDAGATCAIPAGQVENLGKLITDTLNGTCPVDLDQVTVPQLTARERQVLRMISEGLQGPAMADKLGIADGTVRTHVDRLLRRLGAATRAEAVATAGALGLLPQNVHDQRC